MEQVVEALVLSDIHVAPESDGTLQVQDFPPQKEHQYMDVPSEDIKAKYQKRIHDLEQELHTVMKNNQELTCLLNEMGRLVLPEELLERGSALQPSRKDTELSDCTQLSPIEKLKVYLECQLLKKQDPERRAMEAEEAMLEMEHTVAVLQKGVQDADDSSTQLADTVERHPPASSPSPLPPLPTRAPVRFLFSKIHTKSAEKMAAPCLKKQDDASRGEGAEPKWKTMKDALAKFHQGVLPKPGATAGKVKEKPTEHEQKLLQTMNSPEADESSGSHWHLPQLPGSAAANGIHKREASGDMFDAQVHRDGDSGLNTQVQDDDTLSTTSTLPETTPLSRRREDDHDVLLSPSINPKPSAGCPVLEGSETEDLDLSKAATLPSEEGKCESQEGEVMMGKENERANGNPVGFADGTDVPQFSAYAAKPTTRWNVQVTHPVGRDDLLRPGQRLSICFVHQGDNTVHLEPGTSQNLSVKQAPCSDLCFLQKNQEEVSPLPIFPVSPPAKREEGSYLEESASWGASIHLPCISAGSSETQTVTMKKNFPKGLSRVGKAKVEPCISMKGTPVVAVPLDSESRQQSSSGVIALAESGCTESPQQTLPAPANPDGLTEEVNISSEIFL